MPPPRPVCVSAIARAAVCHCRTLSRRRRVADRRALCDDDWHVSGRVSELVHRHRQRGSLPIRRVRRLGRLLPVSCRLDRRKRPPLVSILPVRRALAHCLVDKRNDASRRPGTTFSFNPENPCIACAADEISNGSLSSCTRCKVGTPSVDRRTCACEAGTSYALAGSDECLPCSAGSVSQLASGECARTRRLFCCFTREFVASQRVDRRAPSFGSCSLLCLLASSLSSFTCCDNACASTVRFAKSKMATVSGEQARQNESL